jgi:chromosome partitioning protein
MTNTVTTFGTDGPGDPPFDDLIAADAKVLSAQLQALRERMFAPDARKTLRTFSSGEAAKLIGVSDSYLRQLSLAKEGPQPETTAAGKRLYTLEQINDLRHHLTTANPAGKGRVYLPIRTGDEHMQVIAVTNFKGGSGKTTTAAHLAQYLALRGYRVLAIDLDPQARLSSLFGLQPEFDVGPNETLYGSIRYDDQRRALREVIRKSYFPGLDLVPANLELQEFELMGQRSADDDLFFARVSRALESVDDFYDIVVIDCPPQPGFLTLGALCAATAVLVTVPPQMLDLASMSQFLHMTVDRRSVVRGDGGDLRHDFMRYMVTRHEPNDGPQVQIVGFMRSWFAERVLTNAMLKSTAVSDAGLTKQTLYEVGRENFTRATYDRALESLDAVNGEIDELIRKSWGRKLMSRKENPRKENLRAALMSGHLPPAATPVLPAATKPHLNDEPTPKERRGASPVRMMGLSLGRLSSDAQTAREMKEAMQAGNMVVDLDPDLIDDSFISDRLLNGEDPDFEEFKDGIKTHGQKVPILVRPHPRIEGRYEAAYGHRRLKACSLLGRKVRAVVAQFSDIDLVIAQGKENSDRLDPSYIERAMYARALEDHGFEKAVIMAALSVDKSALSRLLSVAHAIPFDLIKAIGPARKAGRPRWTAFADRFQKASDVSETVLRLTAEDKFREADSDQRFSMLFEALETKRPNAGGHEFWKNARGQPVVRIERSNAATKLAIDENIAPDFGAFLIGRLQALYDEFEAATAASEPTRVTA